MQNINIMKISNSVKTDYEENYHSVRHSGYFNEHYYDAKAYIAKKKYFDRNVDIEDSILDYGCGMGQNIYLLKNAQGYDISEYALNFARSKNVQVTNDLMTIPDNSLDAIFSSHVLEHHLNPREMLIEIYNKMKKGGKLILVLPYERHGRSTFNLDLDQHMFMWNFRTINNLLLIAGFTVHSNEYLRGAGYEKLLPVYMINKTFYRLATNLVARIAGIKEIMVIAQKK